MKIIRNVIKNAHQERYKYTHMYAHSHKHADSRKYDTVWYLVAPLGMITPLRVIVRGVVPDAGGEILCLASHPTKQIVLVE